MINKLDWDSDFFELNVAEINSTDKEKIVIQNKLFDLIYIKSNIDFNLINSNFCISNEEVKLVFSKKINPNKFFKSDNIVSLYELDNFNLNDLYNLAFLSGNYSRFKKDSNIPYQKFEQLYIKWIDNAINKTFNDYFIVYIQNDEIIGMLTMSNFDDYSQIGLISVFEDFKGMGIGTKMILEVENYCFKMNIRELRIPTQEENIEACNFYFKKGYKLINSTIIKHAWRNK